MGRVLSSVHPLELTDQRRNLKLAPLALALTGQPETATTASAATQSLGSIPAGSCLSGGWFRISKVPFTTVHMLFDLEFLWWFLG